MAEGESLDSGDLEGIISQELNIARLQAQGFNLRKILAIEIGLSPSAGEELGRMLFDSMSRDLHQKVKGIGQIQHPVEPTVA